jgi:DNA-binding transcriptional LysR family regulator
MRGKKTLQGQVSRRVDIARGHTQQDRPTTPADLRQHDCLVFSETLGPIEWHFQSHKGRISVKVQGRLCANNLDALVSAAIGGAGIARVPSWQVSADMSAGRLEALLTSYERPAAPVHAVFQHSKIASAKIRTFIDYLVAQWPNEKFAVT